MPRTAEVKLRSPSLGDQAVERPRLIETLDASLAVPGTFAMLSAPAGFGKTFLLAQWADRLSRRGVLTAWCTLTRDDREPLVLWNSLVDALIGAAGCTWPDLAEDLRSLSPALEPLGHAAFLASFSFVIARHPGTIVLIVDGADVLERCDAKLEIIGLLQGTPQNLHVAFATRSAVQTQFARVSGRLVELTAESLSFTRSETEELCSAHELSDHDIEQLLSETEGWPAAVSLAMLRSSSTARGSARIDTSWDDPTDLHDYLRREVYAGLTSSEREVLLTMGVTPTTTPELVRALGGGERSSATLRSLAANNRMLYRHSVDAKGRTWYRVQRVFGSFLREQLRDAGSVRLSEMIATAVGWHVHHGDALAALALALEPPDEALVDDVLRARGYEIVGDGHARELLDMMPPATSAAMRGPFARVMMGYAAASASRPDRSREYLDTPHIGGLDTEDRVEWEWLDYLAHLQLAIATGEPFEVQAPDHNGESLDHQPEALRLAIRLTRGLAETRCGHTTRGIDDLRVAVAQAENDGDLARLLMGTVGLAGVAVSQCDVRRAIFLCERTLELAARSTTHDTSATSATAHGIAAWAHGEMLDTVAARAHAALAVELADIHGDQSVVLFARRVYNETVFSSLPQKRRIAQEIVTAWPPPHLRGGSDVFVVMSLYSGMRMAAALEEPRWSERLLDRARQILGEGPDWQVAYALYQLTIGRDDAARTVIAPLVESPQVGVPLSAIALASLDAVLKCRSNNAYQAHAAIYRALELADETGAYIEVARTDGPTVARILASGLGRFGPHEHVAKRLLAGDIGTSVLNSAPLTVREREILGDLRTLRTVEEIAHDLLLSVNTVKTHMRGIYRKLDVTSRREAVGKAERCGLI
jgi:LuxR family maltose regulon positive regulatory protein